MLSCTDQYTVIPAILKDSQEKMETWGASGTFDPFDKIYEVSASCSLRLRANVYCIPRSSSFRLPSGV
jgi:hypothetical protein